MHYAIEFYDKYHVAMSFLHIQHTVAFYVKCSTRMMILKKEKMLFRLRNHRKSSGRV